MQFPGEKKLNFWTVLLKVEKWISVTNFRIYLAAFNTHLALDYSTLNEIKR